jgi:general secretion pathway protein G
MRGFTLLEFGVIVILVAVISASLLMRYGDMRRDAEQAAARSVLAALNVSLRARVVRAQGDRDALARLANENPVAWLDNPPANYFGEIDAFDPHKVPGDRWVFVKSNKTLVYLPSARESFPFTSSRFLRFKVEFPHALDQGGQALAMTATRGPGSSPVQAPAGR